MNARDDNGCGNGNDNDSRDNNDGDTAEKEFAAAMRRAGRILAGREHAKAELRRKLRAHFSAPAAESAIAAFAENGLLCDDRFARAFVRQKRGQWGDARIRAALLQTGVDDKTARAAIAEECGKTGDDDGDDDGVNVGDNARSETARARAVLQKKHPAAAADYKTRASLMRFLSARGFSPETVCAAMQNIAVTDGNDDDD